MQGSISSQPIVLVQPRRRAALGLLGSVAGLALGGWLVKIGGLYIALGVLDVGLCGLALVRLARLLVQPGVLTISREGIERRLLGRTVRRRWREVADVRIIETKWSSWIYVDSNDGAKSLTLSAWGIAPDRLAELLLQARSTWSSAPALTSAAVDEPQTQFVETPISPAQIALKFASLALLLGGAILTLSAFGGLMTPAQGAQSPGALVQWDVPPTPAQIARGMAGLALGLTGALAALGVTFPRRSELPPLLAILKMANLVVWFLAALALMVGLSTLATWFLKPTYEQQNMAMHVVAYGFIGLVGLVTLVSLARTVWTLRQRTE